MKIIFMTLFLCLLAGCGPGMIAGATVLSGFDAGENLLHDGPDLFQCGHIFGHACPKDAPKSPAGQAAK